METEQDSLMHVTTKSIRETSKNIITITESLDHLVNSIEKLVPIISSVSQEYIRSIKNNELIPEEQTLVSTNIPVTMDNKPQISTEQISELLQNPSLQSILASLSKK
ncbi:hypothetical protein [Desulfonispora thiosulfatigenes]|nr:hypothetical protein [Desulfonispora thiosulfatigenes]